MAFQDVSFSSEDNGLGMSTLDAGFKSSVCRLGRLSQQDGMKGEPKAPVKAFKRELKRYAKRVVDIDEYLTSQTCSCCYCKVTKTVWAERKKKKNDKNKQARKEIDDEENEKKARFVHQIVLCVSNECAMWWQRDINASRNILELLMCELKGDARPIAFSRKKPSETIRFERIT